MSSNLVSGVAFGTALFAAFAAYAYSRSVNSKVDRKSSELVRDGKVLMRLLEGERTGMVKVLSVNTITFFTGKISKEYLQDRVTAIVAANPWLLCRLLKSEEFGDICALYPCKFDPATESHDCFQFLSAPTISPKVPYSELLRKLEKALVPKGIDCLGKDIGQFKVTLIEIKPDQEYALVVSMSHSIGDGHTFYSLYKMLDTKTEVQPLVPNRKHEFSDTLADACGAKYAKWMSSASLITGIVCTLLFKPLPKVAIFTLDQCAIEAVKKSYSASLKPGQYLSTNDIATHWFLRLVGAKYGFMAVNFRGRFSPYQDNMAGNYEAVMYYTKKEFETPVAVRESLSTFNKDIPLPSLLTDLNCEFAAVTNWTNFYADLHLEGEAVQTLHMPLISLDSVGIRDFCVIFNTSKDTRAVMMFTRSKVELSGDTVKVLKDRLV